MTWHASEPLDARHCHPEQSEESPISGQLGYSRFLASLGMTVSWRILREKSCCLLLAVEEDEYFVKPLRPRLLVVIGALDWAPDVVAPGFQS